MKLFYRTFKKAIFNESNQMVYSVKNKWLSASIKNTSNETVVAFTRGCLSDSSKYTVLFNNKEYAGKHTLFTNKIIFDKDEIDIIGDCSFFSSHYTCVIRQAQAPIAVIRRARGHILFEEYEIEIYNPEMEKLALAFLLPALETLSDSIG